MNDLDLIMAWLKERATKNLNEAQPYYACGSFAVGDMFKARSEEDLRISRYIRRRKIDRKGQYITVRKDYKK